MATMNPVDLYHDPALDGLINVPKKSRRTASGNETGPVRSRRSAPEDYDMETNGHLPQAPDAPPGAAISYRGIGPSVDPGLHRSFSQRAKWKSMPYAEEAFNDDELANMNIPALPRQISKSKASRTRHQPHQSGAAQENGLNKQENDDIELPSKREVPLAISGPLRQQSSSTRENHSQPMPETQTPEPIASYYRSATLRDASNQTEEQRQDWASDRSPLQKLEVKLTDISKEEKRARVQEAEMRLMKSKNIGQAPDRPRRSNTGTARAPILLDHDSPHSTDTRRESPTLTKTNSGKASAGMRGTGAATRSQVPQSSGRQNRVPESRRSVSDGRRYSGEPYDNSAFSTTEAVRSQPARQQSPLLKDSRTRDPTRSVPARQTPNGRVTNDASQPRGGRAVSLQQSKSRSRPREDERPVSQHERRASQQAALEQLTAQSPSDVPRSGSRKLQESPPQKKDHAHTAHMMARSSSPAPVDLSSMAGGDPGFDFSQPGQNREVQAQQPPVQYSQTQQPQQYAQRDRSGVGLGLQHPSALRSTDSPPVSSTDVSKQRQRKSSVSFKEPFDRRRPTEEWKQADTAHLMLTDPSAKRTGNSEQDKAWWEQDKNNTNSSNRPRGTGSTHSGETIDDRTAQFKPRLYIKCGPLLRYAGLKRTKEGSKPGMPSAEFWRGSVMIVTQDSQCSYEATPTLRLFPQPQKLLPPPPAHVTAEELTPEYIDPIAGLTKLGRTGRARYVRPIDHLDQERDLSSIEDDHGIFESSPSPLDSNGKKDATSTVNSRRTLSSDAERLGKYKEVQGVRLYADPERDVTFWRFNIEVELGNEQQHIAYRINKGASMGFWVPARGHSMNMMFHTCNGFSMSVDPNTFSGPDPLWRDVLNNHQTRPFHVMIGGGDQIYNDRVMVDTHHFAEWTAIRNPHHKHEAEFTSEMKEELESFYLERYCSWFSQGLFGMANASIPMINIWDDHDIIDGFGSYPHEFMRTPVFSGLGNVAYKYYMLFQHQSIEAMTEKDEPSWILGHAPGPYIQARSRSLYLELGQSIAFLGIDCRTERTKNDVLSIDTLEIILDRCRREMVEGQTKHLIVLLGVPIAYPRLVWLENVLTSRAMDPIKALGRAGILKTKMLNRFDGGVEILDDLDDHWTASHHKDERNILIQELQDLAAEKSVRVTILGGDVHLAAIGQFYSNPKLKIPKDRDHRYMPNVISSAIVNTPPPEFMADVMNKRNKVHHLDKYTDENMIPMFTHDVDGKKRNNNSLLPRRNWCSIREYLPGETPPPSPPSTPSMSDDDASLPEEQQEGSAYDQPKRRPSFTKNDFNPRSLMRRLSSRGKVPPSSYKTEQNSDRPPQARSASFDGIDSTHNQQTQREQSGSERAASADNLKDARGFRPTFHRRPTNLSEKAARKGNVLAVDAEGNEFDVNDDVNLEGGLDISINCEIDQKDPAGITTPYRLLIPALWYDGSSDREKITDDAPIARKNTVLQRLGLGPRRTHSAADKQGAGNWGQEMSETESYDGNEKMAREKPKRSFSLFGSKRNKKAPENDEIYYNENHTSPHASGQNDQALPNDNHESAFAGSRHATTKSEHYNRSQDYDNSYNEASYPEPEKLPSGVPDSDSQSRSISQPQVQQQYQPEQETRHERPSVITQRKARPMSYTIGGSAPMNPQPTSLQQPYDADAAYLEAQRQQEARYSQIMQSSQPPQAYRSSEPNVPQRKSSKQERILGIGSAADAGFTQPNQTKLRGNGIIGKNVSSDESSSQHNDNQRSKSHSHHHHHDQNQSHGHHNQSREQHEHEHRSQTQDHTQNQNQSQYGNNPPQEYTGIEAYKEPKPKRNWSLSIRDKARGLFDSVEGRRRKDDLYSDDEEDRGWDEDERYQREGQQYLQQPPAYQGGGSGRNGEESRY